MQAMDRGTKRIQIRIKQRILYTIHLQMGNRTFATRTFATRNFFFYPGQITGFF